MAKILSFLSIRNLPMTTAFNWTISQAERELLDGYVYSVSYVIEAFDDEGYTAGTIGSIDLPRPVGELIPFESLTEDLVVSWVKNRIGADKVSTIENNLKSQLDEQHAPSTAKGLPWSSNKPL